MIGIDHWKGSVDEIFVCIVRVVTQSLIDLRQPRPSREPTCGRRAYLWHPAGGAGQASLLMAPGRRSRHRRAYLWHPAGWAGHKDLGGAKGCSNLSRSKELFKIKHTGKHGRSIAQFNHTGSSSIPASTCTMGDELEGRLNCELLLHSQNWIANCWRALCLWQTVECTELPKGQNASWCAI